MALDRQLQIRDSRRRAEEEAEVRLIREGCGADRATRLRAWREWAAKHLLATFNHWPTDQAARDHLIGLCIAEMESIARHCYERRWLFNGKRLTQIVKQAVEPVAAAQAAGKVKDFYPYFRSSIRRFVGMNESDLQQAARRDGVDGAAAIGDILAGVLNRLRTPSLVEDIAERQEETWQAACKAGASGRSARHKDGDEGGQLELL